MHRGCISDLDPNRFQCDKAESVCEKCNQSGCNNGKIDSLPIETESTIIIDESFISNQLIQTGTKPTENSSHKLTGGFVLITLFLLKFV